MALTPHKVGSVTLARLVTTDVVSETWTGILDEPVGKPVWARRVSPSLTRDPRARASILTRCAQLVALDVPAMIPTLQVVDEGASDLWVVSEWSDTLSLADIIAESTRLDSRIPAAVFLHLATAICTALDGIHNADILHLGLCPDAIRVGRDGEISIGQPGLVSSPTFAAHTGSFKLDRLYVPPEQTFDDTELTPASDLFSLGAVLYELLTGKAMFTGRSPLRTIAQVRHAEVTTPLLEVKEILPGFDRILYRAMAQSHRHRYQRAYVLREDMRGLMAGYSFSNIGSECRRFLEPMFGSASAAERVWPEPPAPSDSGDQGLGSSNISGLHLPSSATPGESSPRIEALAPSQPAPLTVTANIAPHRPDPLPSPQAEPPSVEEPAGLSITVIAAGSALIMGLVAAVVAVAVLL